MKNISVIIPSLDPDLRLSGVVDSLLELGFTDIILVDDGSKPENKKNFPVCDNVTLLIHKVNLGKGEALKTAMKYVLENRPETSGVVTCDGDGQHLAYDIKKVCEEMISTGNFILGCRDFSEPQVPFKSKLGNRVSAFALSLFCGVKITDTQTGLRAIPKILLQPMIEVPGSRFEYETNVLLELGNMHAKCSEVKIQTVYHDENKGSHFRPIKDTLRICSFIFKYLFSSFFSFLADIILFTILNYALKTDVIVSTVIARIISSLINFYLNRKIVFKTGAPVIKSLLKYYMLAIPVMLVSAFGVTGVATLLGVDANSITVTVIKIIVDTIIFILNYRVQKLWVFSNRKG